MDFIKQNTANATKFIVVIVAFVAIIGLFAATIIDASNSHIFDLRFNIYALVSLVAVITNLAFLFLATRINIRGTEAVWFNILISTITIFALSEFFMRLSATPDGAIFWGKFQGVVALEVGSAYLFVLNYLNPRIKHVRTTVILLLGSFLMFFFFVNGNLLINNNPADIELYSWGYYNDIGHYFIFQTIWVLGVSATIFFLLIKYVQNSTNPVLAKQARLFLIAFSLIAFGGIVTEMILPSFGIKIFSLHIVFSAIAAGMMLWGLKRYHIFKISPALISEDILSLMHEAVVVVNTNLEIEYTNRGSEQLLGKTGDELARRSLLDFITKESAESISMSIKNLADKVIQSDHEEALLKSSIIVNNQEGHNTYAQLSISRATEENGIDGYIMVFEDVTELKNSYEALEKEKASIEHTVQVRTKELREAKARILDTDKMKTEFVLLTSHNLRTPLSAIKGNIELLTLPSFNDIQKQNLIQGLQAATSKLGNLVEDLLTISTIEAGEGAWREEADLQETIKPLLEESAELAYKTSNKFSTHITDEEVKVLINIRQFRTALRNLLENAFKFTQEGEVTLIANVIGGQLIMAVKDTGMGIASEELPKLFTKFHRTTDTLRYEYDGEGIGLYLTKLIIEEHDGSIAVKSAKGEGSTFTITLPLSKNNPASS